MVDPIEGWHREHEKFRQLLGVLEREVDAFHRGEQPNYELMGDIVYYLRHFADRVHHPREDAAFKRLVELEPALNLVINRLLQEHRVIAVAGEELLKFLDEAAGDVMVPRSEVESAAATFLVYYRNHLNVEERQVMPRAAALLDARDWAAVEKSVASLPDPLFGRTVGARFAELRRQLDRDAAILQRDR